MARWTKTLLKQQLCWTNVCFRQALLDVYGSHLSEVEKTLTEPSLRELITARLNIDLAYKGWPPPVNEAYLANLRKLPTDQIELIVEAYHKAKQYRSPLTIDVLTTELFERSIKSETRSKV